MEMTSPANDTEENQTEAQAEESPNVFVNTQDNNKALSPESDNELSLAMPQISLESFTLTDNKNEN